MQCFDWLACKKAVNMIGGNYHSAGNSAFLCESRGKNSWLARNMAAKRARIESWTRDDIVCCNCSELKSRHVHCPCSYCNGAAVARSLEYFHWQEQQKQEICGLMVNRWEYTWHYRTSTCLHLLLKLIFRLSKPLIRFNYSCGLTKSISSLLTIRFYRCSK